VVGRRNSLPTTARVFLEDLDRIAPANPVVLQAVYNQSYLNTAALKAPP